jgi:hypothetical protein
LNSGDEVEIPQLPGNLIAVTETTESCFTDSVIPSRHSLLQALEDYLEGIRHLINKILKICLLHGSFYLVYVGN